MKLIKRHIDQIIKLCVQYRVRSLFAFGSITNEKFRSDSDIDLVVDIDSNDPLEYSDYYFGLKFKLEQLLKRQIDLLEYKSIKNPFLINEIEQSKVLVYGK